jgi:hypothetical protein
MRRYAFYLAVGFITFGVSIFAYVTFTMWKVCKAESEGFKRTKSAESFQKQPEQVEFIEKNAKKIMDFKCENQYLLAVWNHLRKDNDYKELFDSGKITDCSEVFGISDTVDLNNDEDKEAVVSDNGWRSGVFNQSFWIVQKVGKDYKIILEGKDVEYEPKNQINNGFFDINITTKWRGGERTLKIYQFNGSNYVPKKCYVEYTWILKNDEKIELEKPMISRVSCN